IIYTYIGYPVILWVLVKVRNKKVPDHDHISPVYEPVVCLFVTAFNEKAYVRQKVENSLQLDYPKEKIQYLWVTDGSDDGTPDLLREYIQNEVYHLPERKGKMHAMNRGMQFVNASVVIFSDTNTLLNKN